MEGTETRQVSSSDAAPAEERGAEEIYAAFLRAGRRSEELSAVCAQHPEHADALRFLRSFHGGLCETLGSQGAADSVDRALEAFLAQGPPADGVPAGAGGLCAGEIATRTSFATGGPKRFEVLRELGRGGMSVVLEVRDPDLERTLALKVLARRDGPFADRMALALRFLREARVTSRLEHPGVVPVHEVGIDPEGHVFFTMPIVRGKTLHELLDERRRGEGVSSLERFVALLARVAETLSYAHSRGVVHRDLKPSNVMVGEFGEVYVMDWGLAREPRREASPQRGSDSQPDGACAAPGELGPDCLATLPGAVLGTPAFMPPEQAAGRPADERSDVYSLGAILYTLLSGRIPYVESGSRPDSRAVLDAVLAGPPAPLDAVAPRASAELAAIAGRAMARDPEERYPSMHELGADLQAFLDGRVVRAHRTGALAELRKWVQRNRAVAVVSFTALLAAAGGLAVTAFLQGRARTEIVRLSDLKALEDLKAEAGVLEPLLPRHPDVCGAWLERVDDLVSRRPEHRRRLDSLRERGTQRQIPSARSFRAYLPLSARHGELDTEVALLRNRTRVLARFALEYRGWRSPAILDARRRSLELELGRVERERRRVAAKLLEIGHWDFKSEDDQWLHDQLVTLLTEIELLLDEESQGALPRFQRRLRISHLCWETSREKWRTAIEAVAAHPAYRGLRLEPQHDLVPLGPDPQSGLWEFAHPESGEVPARDASGRLFLGDRSCIVLVLLPLSSDAGALRLFFSKFEMTQGQWQTLSGRNPSHFAAGVAAGDGREITLRHPVEGLTNDEAMKVLRRSGLSLPHRIDWTRAAAAGRKLRWPSGDEKRSLAGHANHRDRTSAAQGGFGIPEHENWLEDGFFLHAPVGSFQPNAYGLHDMAGNVREWCRGAAVTGAPRGGDFLVPQDGLETAGVITARPALGGSFRDLAEEAEVERWMRMDGSARSGTIGVRPVRSLGRHGGSTREDGDGEDDGDIGNGRDAGADDDGAPGASPRG